MVFVGVDWAEAHNDVLVMDEAGAVLGRRRCRVGVEGLAELHGLIADHADEPEQVVIGIELDSGLLVSSLVGAGYAVYAINPLAASRYRERHTTSGAKSDAGDAKLLADLVRTDRHNHRPVAGDSDEAGAIRALARAHQGLVWTRRRQVNALRSGLRDYFPGALAAFGTDLDSTDALAVLGIAPTPALGRELSRTKIAAALRRAGRSRNLERRAAEIQAALRAPQPEASPALADALGAVTRAAVALIGPLNEQIGALEARLAERFSRHPDAEILSSLPGLGVVLGARVLGEFGDEPNRYADAKGRKATRAPPRSPGPRGAARSSWPGWRATAASPMPVSCGPSAHSPNRPGRGATTTRCAPGARPTARPFASWPTAGSGSSTAAWRRARATGRRSPGRPRGRYR